MYIVATKSLNTDKFLIAMKVEITKQMCTCTWSLHLLSVSFPACLAYSYEKNNMIMKIKQHELCYFSSCFIYTNLGYTDYTNVHILFPVN